MSDLATMRGRFSAPEMRGDKMVLTAELPAATSMDYPTELAAYTGGRGLMTARLKAYEPVDLTLGRTCERRGIDPPNTSSPRARRFRRACNLSRKHAPFKARPKALFSQNAALQRAACKKV